MTQLNGHLGSMIYKIQKVTKYSQIYSDKVNFNKLLKIDNILKKETSDILYAFLT